MFKNILKIALRNIKKNKAYTFINVFGLSVGLACSIIIILFVINELTYDSYHKDSDRIYRIISENNSPTSGIIYRASVPGPMATHIKKDLPQIEEAVRMVPPYENSNNVLIVKNNNRFFENRIFFTDPEIFKVFKIPFIKGNVNKALTKPGTVLITEKMAKKYYGSEDPVGKVLQMEFDYDIGSSRVKLQDFKITGIIKNSPANSHLKYNMLVSIETLKSNLPNFEDNWVNWHGKHTYVKLKENSDIKKFEDQLQTYAKIAMQKFEVKYKRKSLGTKYLIQPITSIHMEKRKIRELEPKGNWFYIYIYSLIAFLVLLIGCMNFINLSTVISTTRAKEVGLRKVIGARRVQLIWQFLSESKLITLLSFIAAIGIAVILLPFFNIMAGTELSIGNIFNPIVIISLLILFLIVSISSGIFPAFILTGFKPVSIFQGRFNIRLKGSLMQKVLVIGQFAISIFLVICTLFIIKQLDFMKGRALGFDREQKLILRVKSNLSHLMKDYEDIKNSFTQNPGITGASVSSFVPGDKKNGWYGIWKEGANRKGMKGFTAITMGPNFIPLYDIKMKKGRSFQNGKADIDGAFIINETGVKHLGFSSPDEAIGKRYTTHYSRKTKTIVGVIKDFHYRGMQEKIEPLILDIEKSLFNTITLNIDTHKIKEVMANVKTVWGEHFAGVPIEYSFMDDNFNQVYKYEEQMSQLLKIITLLGIIIACLGLSGLASFLAWKRQKEIGVRKVLGASVRDIVKTLSQQFVLLVIGSILIASPLAWLAMNKWLENFAYRTSLGASIFIIASLSTLIVAALSVIFQGIRAANQNPIDSLRNE